MIERQAKFISKLISPLFISLLPTRFPLFQSNSNSVYRNKIFAVDKLRIWELLLNNFDVFLLLLFSVHERKLFIKAERNK